MRLRGGIADIMKNLVMLLPITLVVCFFAMPSQSGTDVDKHLTQQIADILTDCQKLKPGMTRAELPKVFTTEGGLSTAKHRTFVHRRCPYIKVDVDFDLPDPKQCVVAERPADTTSRISRPYLGWGILD